MRILPVSFTYASNINQMYRIKKENTSLKSNDQISFGTILDRQIGELKQTFEDEILPFKEKNLPKYIQIGKIGYDSQEKLKIAKDYAQELFNKKFTYQENTVLKNVKKSVEPYEKYLKNIKEFEKTSGFIQNNENYSTAEIRQFIKKSTPKIYQGSEEFEKLKPLYDKYELTKDNIDAELDAAGIQTRPEFAKQLEKLDTQNKEAVMIMLISGYPEMLKITTDAQKLFKDYSEKNEPLYKLLERTEKLNEDTQNFIKNNIDNSTRIDNEIELFLEKNKNYKEVNLSAEEIKTTYIELINQTDKIIEKHTGVLNSYYNSQKIKVSPRIIDKTLKAQERVNKKLNELLLQEKQKFYHT